MTVERKQAHRDPGFLVPQRAGVDNAVERHDFKDFQIKWAALQRRFRELNAALQLSGLGNYFALEDFRGMVIDAVGKGHLDKIRSQKDSAEQMVSELVALRQDAL